MNIILKNALDYLEKNNQYQKAEEPNAKVPEYIVDNNIGYNACLDNFRKYISARDAEISKYKLPGHDETMSSLESLSIKNKKKP